MARVRTVGYPGAPVYRASLSRINKLVNKLIYHWRIFFPRGSRVPLRKSLTRPGPINNGPKRGDEFAPRRIGSLASLLRYNHSSTVAINAIQGSATRSLFAQFVIFFVTVSRSGEGIGMWFVPRCPIRVTKILESINEIIVQIEEEELLVCKIWLVISCKSNIIIKVRYKSFTDIL